MDTKKLRQKILDLAIRGKLVPQDPNDEPASVLLERIKAEKERLIKEGKIKRSKKTTKTSDTPHYENVPFEVPKGWCWCRLEEIAYVTSGSTPNKESFASEGIPYLKMYNLRNQKIDFDFKPQYIKAEVHNGKLKRSRTEVGDLIMNIVGPPLGKLAIIPSSLPQANFNQAAVLIRPLLYKTVLTKYLFYYLSEMSEINSISTKGSAGQINISLTQSQNIRVPLPPLSEQNRIITEIEYYFVLINNIEQSQIDLQTAIKQTKSKILNLAIHGKLVPQDPSDEPASELLKRINPKAEITCDNAQYRKIPKNWCACKLVDICSFLSRGKSPKYSEEDKTYPVFAQKCNLKDGGVSLEQAKFLDPSTINKWNEVYKLQTGDILVNSTGTGTVGRTRLFNTNCLGNYPFVVPDSHVSVVRVLKSICPQYVYAYISSDSIQRYMEENLAGSTNQKELYIGVLENMHIFLPPLAEQYRIVAKIEKLFSSLNNIQKALEV
ncbi:restriction endonuclease subunit S [Phocaeicola plebeius]|uniref:restriction endonuclease subunit S n=2 Tax=Phocaeicola plebeius TaxID=310297 RepID=UPI003A955591